MYLITCMKKIRIGINGFGRIGRMIFRAALERSDMEIAGINDLLDIDYIAYLIKHDSVHGKFKYDIQIRNNQLIINNTEIRITSEKDPSRLKWNEIDTDFVIESTGRFLTHEKASAHLKAGARKVILSAPPKDHTPMFVFGVNHQSYNNETIISNASCTTNCLAPLVKVLNDRFGIKEGLMTTIHPVTVSQSITDSVSERDFRSGRAGLANIIPYRTGAAKSIGKVIPDLNGKLTGICFRIPTLDVSAIDLSVELNTSTSYDEICSVIKEQAEGEMKGIIGYLNTDIVSSDLLGETIPSLFDANAGTEVSDRFFKIIAWYDNETGFSNQLLNMIKYISDTEHCSNVALLSTPALQKNCYPEYCDPCS